MYLLEIDHMQNRIHITLSDRFDELQAKSLSDELRMRFEELEEDFHVLCDLSTLEHIDHAARAHIREAMDLCNEGGASKIVRIIPNPLQNFGLTIMSHFHYGTGVKIVTCKDFKEALEHLKS